MRLQHHAQHWHSEESALEELGEHSSRLGRRAQSLQQSMPGGCHRWMKAVGAKRSSNSLMLEEAGRGDCLEEGPGSLHRRVEM